MKCGISDKIQWKIFESHYLKNLAKINHLRRREKKANYGFIEYKK
jgi:hypothetical protein